MRFAGWSAGELSKSERESCMESCVKPRDLYCSGSSILLTFEAVHVIKHLLWRTPVSKDTNMKQLPLLNNFFPFFLYHYCLSLRCLFLLVIFFGKWDSCLQVLKGMLSCECQKPSLLASIIVWLSFWIWSSLGKCSIAVWWGDNSFSYFCWAF